MLGTALVVKLLLDTQLRKTYLIVRGGKSKSISNMNSQMFELETEIEEKTGSWLVSQHSCHLSLPPEYRKTAG